MTKPHTPAARLTQAILMVTFGSEQPPGRAGLVKPLMMWLPGLHTLSMRASRRY